MAQATIAFEVKVSGLKEAVKQNQYINDVFVKDIRGFKNRRIIGKMRQKLQVLFPGAKIAATTDGIGMKFKVDNIKGISSMEYNKTVIELTKTMDSLQQQEFNLAKEQRK